VQSSTILGGCKHESRIVRSSVSRWSTRTFLSACGPFQHAVKREGAPPSIGQAPPPSPRPATVEATAPAHAPAAKETPLPPPVAKKEAGHALFPDVLVHIAPALICIGTKCNRALVGPGTPRGKFQLTYYSTPDPGYGGDILTFKETSHDLYAIHRVINVPGQQRLARLKSPHPTRRNSITGGCINVDPIVYDELVECCYASKLIID
jgi:hypothetical protein